MHPSGARAPKQLKEDSDNPLRTLSRVQQYAAFVRERDKEKLTKEQQADEDRRLNMLVDWHDFVVVETIGFDDEEKLPAPQALDEKAAAEAHNSRYCRRRLLLRLLLQALKRRGPQYLQVVLVVGYYRP